MTCAPVIFQIFNRPGTTARTFAAIREARPEVLLVVADGPRAKREGEASLCAQTRAIAQAVDWPCDVRLNFSDVNLGCGRRVSSGFDWAFEQVESAIIIEDDCLPDPSFFPYCTELLERYRDDDRIFMVSGNNFQTGRRPPAQSYYFSRIPHCWGWATWRRAWRRYDFNMTGWAQLRRAHVLRAVAGDSHLERVWTSALDRTLGGEIDTWDYQWLYCMAFNEALSVVPEVNLVRNIGFGDAAATHTFTVDERHSVPAQPIAFPLRHPREVRADEEADRFENGYLYHLDDLRWIDRVRPYCWPFVAVLRPGLEQIGLWPYMRAWASRRVSRTS